MIWQDAVIMAGSFGLTVALVPAVLRRQPPPMSTCLVFGGILCVFAVCFATLGLRLSFIAHIVGCSFWFVLAHQSRGR